MNYIEVNHPQYEVYIRIPTGGLTPTERACLDALMRKVSSNIVTGAAQLDEGELLVWPEINYQEK